MHGKASVLCYHRLTQLRYTGRGFHPNIYLCVHDQNFDDQIRLLVSRYTVQPLGKIVGEIAEPRRGKHKVAITFDDGYRDNLELALPILEKYDAPATIFIAPGLIDRSATLWWEELAFIVSHSRALEFEWDGSKYEFKLTDDNARQVAYPELNRLCKRLSANQQARLLAILRPQCPVSFSYDDLLLTWDEIKKLAQHPLITLGCHTIRHPILSNETESEALSEMSESRQQLSEKIGLGVDLFAYPVGGADEATVREFALAERVGFKASFTTRTGHLFNRHEDHMQCLPRITLDYFDCIDAFKWKLSGVPAFMKNGGDRFVTV